MKQKPIPMASQNDQLFIVLISLLLEEVLRKRRTHTVRQAMTHIIEAAHVGSGCNPNIPKRLIQKIHKIPQDSSLHLLKMYIDEQCNRAAVRVNEKAWQGEYAGQWVAIHRGKIIHSCATIQEMDQYIDSKESQQYTGNILLHYFKKSRTKSSKSKIRPNKAKE